MSNSNDALPPSWESVKLGKFVENEKGKKPKKQTAEKTPECNLPYVDIEAFEEGNIKSWTNGDSCRVCYESDFLMVWDGSRSGLIGKGMHGALGSTLVRINFPGMNNQYAYYFLLSKYQEINTRAKGSGTPHVDPDLLWNYEFPIAPFNEQQRIVAKIEELFSELDNGIAALKTAREQLKVYRQALLKHAFEGKLTAKWREENTDKLESPEQLLARIQQEREARYQQQLEEWKAAVKKWEEQGKEGKKPGKPAKPTRIAQATDEDLSELPVGWVWINYVGICEQIRNGISAKPSGGSGDKMFRISAVRAMEFNLDDIRYLQDPEGHYHDYFLSKGDLVFTRYNGTRDYVGVCAEYKGDGTHLYPDKLIQTRIGVDSVLPSYLEKAINCGGSRKFMEKRIRTTAGQSGISGSDVKQMPVPICCRDEQAIIELNLERKLSNIKAIGEEIEAGLRRSETLRQSILKKAFSGQLVPPDPNDEPASELLERIKAENAAEQPKKTKKKSTAKRARRKTKEGAS